MDVSVIRDSVDLVSVAEAAGVELKRSGNRHVGLCPFHADETPSFTVFPDGHFHCFGCGEHGDAIDFIQRLHGYTFKEALKILGVDRGPLTREQCQKVKTLQHRRKLIEAFRRWEIEATDQVATFCRACRKVLGEINSPEDLETYGERYHDLAVYEHHLDILAGNDDQAKLQLFRSELYV
ncbi:MAG: hypothetical protein DRH17_03345 [Deltaproteobacteria bacterium]|nr:MAG: hypothetical protein DRH17_03345 [Deltaproteobacteria bacterium]